MQLKRRLMMAGATLFSGLRCRPCGAERNDHCRSAAGAWSPRSRRRRPIRPRCRSFSLPQRPSLRRSPPLPSAAELAAPILPAPAARPLPPQAAPLMLPGAETPTAAAAPDCTATAGYRAAARGDARIWRCWRPAGPSERVVIRHAGLAVTGRTSASGALFAEPARAGTRRPRCRSCSPVARRPRHISTCPRRTCTAALPCSGWATDAFQLHAFENGADYGTPGHVSAADPQAPRRGAGPRYRFSDPAGRRQR